MAGGKSAFRYIVLLGILVLSGLASVAASPGPSARLADALREIPPDRVASGILYDRVLPLSGIERFDGSAAAPPATLREWRQMYSEMRRAALEPPDWPDLRLPERDEVIPIAILDLEYQRFREDAFETGALIERGGRLALKDASADPFLTRRVFAASALRDHTYQGQQQVFRLDPRESFSNDGEPRSIEVDFGDGLGYQPVPFGREHLVRYDETGEKTIRLRIAFAGGDVRHAAFVFDVRSLLTPTPNDTLHLTASIPYQGIAGTGDAYVYLAGGHTSLTNPVVVVEGFDLDNSMNWEELYQLLNREQLIETLRAEGFDAVVLNFTDATDFMQRNAFLLIELLSQVQGAAPGRPFPLAGASMGGLISRYALSYMETNSLPHQVSTFISFDSPQRGADLPLGIQYWLDFFADDSPEAAALLASLDRPAARQLLAYHHTSPPGSTGQADPLRGQFLADLAALGDYPASPRKVAVANGSGSRASQGFNAGDQIIRWEYQSFLVDVTGNVWAVPDAVGHTIFHGLIDIILLPQEQQIVSISGSRPYDNAPGGWRSSMAQMDATPAPYGDILALYPNHCFIPTVSALALETDDLFYDIAGDPDILSHTPFDAVYFPSGNQEHVEINPQNAVWLLDEIRGAVTGVDGPPRAAAIATIETALPNPFRGSTSIRFAVPERGPVRLAVHDANGRQVAVIADEVFEIGSHVRAWTPAAATAAGVYFLRLRGEHFAASRKIVAR